MHKRNGYISIIKFISILNIIIMHYGISFRKSYFLEGAYIFVDLCFLLQGFFYADLEIFAGADAKVSFNKKIIFILVNNYINFTQ